MIQTTREFSLPDAPIRCSRCVNTLGQTDTGLLCMRCVDDDASRDTAFAHVSLCRLCGCNYRVPVLKRTKRCVMLQHPQRPGCTFRIPSYYFDKGSLTVRNGWAIVAWSDKAARTMDAERNWQT